MTVWVWLALGGAVFIAAIMFSLRLRRRGTTSLDDDRARGLARIRQTKEEIFEEQNRMTLGEHVCIARAGLEDLMRLAGYAPCVDIADVMPHEQELVLRLQGETLRVRLHMRECQLRQGRMVRQRVYWRLQGAHIAEEYDDLAALMCAVSHILGVGLEEAGGEYKNENHKEGGDDIQPEMPHFARRFVHRGVRRQE